MSDNGASGNRRKPNNSTLYMGKATLYEGGIRVPLIIAGPKVKTGYNATAVNGTDLFATFAAWAGADIRNTESEDLTPLLQGNIKSFQRKYDLLFHFPHYGRGIKMPQIALIKDNWKLLRNWDEGTDKLFNLAEDLGESNNLAAQKPALYQQMQQALDSRLKQVGAQLPAPNE